ncbi:MAG: CarD family transcriptional regulator [Beijerinckiaceae bacterium]|nr:CarD family transcriptional regulator [Beijerinckiaceae bacterium]
MSAKTKTEPNRKASEKRVDQSVKTGAAQAKPKTSTVLKKTGGAAVLQQSIDTPRAHESEKGAASTVPVSAPRDAAESFDTAATSGEILVGKGKVEVPDKKLKKTTGLSAAVTAPVDAASAPQAAAVVHVKSEPIVPEQAKPVAVRSDDKTAPKAAAKPTSNRTGFKTSEYIVYPAHGVGQITAIEEQEVAGYKLELFVISFIKDKMILKVPTPKVASVGMRKLAEAPVVKRALDTLTGRARVKRTMWSRRAQEYEAKINSGDLVAIAEVVRDLYRSDAQPEQSYSERQLYEAALDRIAREIAVVQKLTDQEALKLIDEQLQKGPRRVKAEEADAVEDDTEEDTDGIVEAA